MAAMILTPDELRELTRCTRSDAQRRELEHLGIPFKVRRDGTLIVLRRDIEGSSATIVQDEPELLP